MMSNAGIAIEVAGWLGAGMLLFAYGIVSYGFTGSSGMMYQSLNLAGSVLLIMNTAWHGAWPSSVLNIVWAVIAMGVMIRARWARYRSPEAESDGGF